MNTNLLIEFVKPNLSLTYMFLFRKMIESISSAYKPPKQARAFGELISQTPRKQENLREREFDRNINKLSKPG